MDRNRQTVTDMWQEDTLRQLTELLRPREDVKALFLFGSSAESRQRFQDVWSDIDAVIVISDGAMDRYYPATDWLRPLGEIYAFDQSANGVHYSVTRICYTDFRRIDLIVTTESSFSRIDEWPSIPFWQGAQVLFSRSAAVDGVLAKTFERPELRLITPEQLESMANSFRFKGMLSVNKVMRGDLLIALHLALEMVQDCCVLAMLLRDRAEGTSHHRTGGVGNLAVAELDAVRQPYTAAGILATLESCAVMFDRLASQWSDRYRESRHPLIAWIEHARRHLPG